MEAVDHFVKAFNPNQPRDSHGRFGEIAGAAAHALSGLVGSSGNAAHVASHIAGIFKGHAPKLDLSKFTNYPHISDEEDAVAHLRSMASSFLKGNVLDPREKSAIGMYAVSSDKINSILRHGYSMDNENEFIKLYLDSAIAKSKTTAPFKLYRGVGAGSMNRFLTGDVVVDKGFLSTSFRKSNAEIFIRDHLANAAKGGGTGGIAHIYVKQGMRALIPDGEAGSYEQEHEVLLPRGSRLRLLHVSAPEKHLKLRQVHMELL